MCSYMYVGLSRVYVYVCRHISCVVICIIFSSLACEIMNKECCCFEGKL